MIQKPEFANLCLHLHEYGTSCLQNRTLPSLFAFHVHGLNIQIGEMAGSGQ
jgi:hypothetical protein